MRDRKAISLAAKETRKARKLEKRMAHIQACTAKLLKNGWDLRPVVGRDENCPMDSKRLEWFKHREADVYWHSEFLEEACQQQNRSIEYARKEFQDKMEKHLEETGWVKSETLKDRWMFPHWGKTGFGAVRPEFAEILSGYLENRFYVTSLKNAYAQQLKSDREPLPEKEEF